MSATDYRHVSFALELIMMRTGILYTPDCEWSREQIACMLAHCYWHTLAFIFIIVFIFVLFYHLLCVLCVRITF